MPVYIAARDLDGFPIGTHQFIIIIIIENKSNPHPAAKLNANMIPPKILGNGMLGHVIGAHNQSGLVVEYFEKSDYKATLEYFDKKMVHFYKSDYDTEVIKVVFPNKNEQIAIREIYDLVNAYHINQSIDKIKYPSMGLGFNSNSWVQTVIELAGGKVKSDLKGFDIANNKRIPKTYFLPYCPVKQRPPVN